MKILHINCNYMDSWLHQTMINTLENFAVENKVFVALYKKEGHMVEPNDYVNVAVCFRKWDRAIYHYKQHKIYKRLIKDYNFAEFSCLHAYTLFTDGNVTRKLAKTYGLPYVVAVRNTDVNVFFKHMICLRTLGVRILRDAKAVFFLSKTYQEQVLNKYVPEKYRKEIENKSHIIPNGIDDFWHNNLGANKDITEVQEKLATQNIKLVYVGGIDKNKNIISTCNAVDLLKKSGWNIEFTIVGKIKDNSVFRVIKDKVNYLEARPKEELIEVYRNSDIFVMPSHAETFGLVYAEAMSQGLPVIYTRGQGFDGQFDNGVVGYSVSDINVQEIADAIKLCISNYMLLHKNCLKLVRKFKWQDICEKYNMIYKEITSMDDLKR